MNKRLSNPFVWITGEGRMGHDLQCTPFSDWSKYPLSVIILQQASKFNITDDFPTVVPKRVLNSVETVMFQVPVYVPAGKRTCLNAIYNTI